MFDAVLTGGSAPERRVGSGLVLTVVAHAVVFASVIYVSTHTPKEIKTDREVKFIAPQGMPPPPPPPPPPPAGGSTKPKVEQKKPTPVKKPDTLVETKDKEEEPEKPKEPEKKEDTVGQAGGVEGGVDGGVVGGTVGGTVGGVIGGVLGGTLGGQLGSTAPLNQTLSFGEGMTPPVLQSGVQTPDFPREAREAKVEGKVIAKCTITEDGRLVECRIIKSLPFLDGPVLAALASRKYSPVMFQGRAVRVYYTFPFTFKMP